MRVAGFIGHDAYIFPTEAIATVIFSEYDLFLQHHHQLTRFTVLLEKIFSTCQFVNMFPSTPRKGFHISREADIFKYMIPVKGESEVTERFIRCIKREVP